MGHVPWAIGPSFSAFLAGGPQAQSHTTLSCITSMTVDSRLPDDTSPNELDAFRPPCSTAFVFFFLAGAPQARSRRAPFCIVSMTIGSRLLEDATPKELKASCPPRSIGFLFFFLY